MDIYYINIKYLNYNNYHVFNTKLIFVSNPISHCKYTHTYLYKLVTSYKTIENQTFAI